MIYIRTEHENNVPTTTFNDCFEQYKKIKYFTSQDIGKVDFLLYQLMEIYTDCQLIAEWLDPYSRITKDLFFTLPENEESFCKITSYTNHHYGPGKISISGDRFSSVFLADYKDNVGEHFLRYSQGMKICKDSEDMTFYLNQIVGNGLWTYIDITSDKVCPHLAQNTILGGNNTYTCPDYLSGRLSSDRTRCSVYTAEIPDNHSFFQHTADTCLDNYESLCSLKIEHEKTDEINKETENIEKRTRLYTAQNAALMETNAALKEANKTAESTAASYTAVADKGRQAMTVAADATASFEKENNSIENNNTLLEKNRTLQPESAEKKEEDLLCSKFESYPAFREVLEEAVKDNVFWWNKELGKFETKHLITLKDFINLWSDYVSDTDRKWKNVSDHFLRDSKPINTGSLKTASLKSDIADTDMYYQKLDANTEKYTGIIEKALKKKTK